MSLNGNLVKLKAAYALLKDSCSAWVDDNAPSMGAALAFYTVSPRKVESVPGQNDKRVDPSLRVRRY